MVSRAYLFFLSVHVCVIPQEVAHTVRCTKCDEGGGMTGMTHQITTPVTICNTLCEV